MFEELIDEEDIRCLLDQQSPIDLKSILKRAEPRCFHATLPILGLPSILSAAVLKSLAKKCKIHLLLHDHLVPLYSNRSSSEECRRYLLFLYDYFGSKLQGKIESIRYSSHVLSEIVTDDAFNLVLKDLDLENELVPAIKRLTAAKIIPNLKLPIFISWAAEYFIAARPLKYTQSPVIDFVLAGKDRGQLYSLVKDRALRVFEIERDIWSVDFLFIKELFFGSADPKFDLKVGMYSPEIERKILRALPSNESDRIKFLEDLLSALKPIQMDLKGEKSNLTSEKVEVGKLSDEIYNVFQEIESIVRGRDIDELPLAAQRTYEPEFDELGGILKFFGTPLALHLYYMIYKHPDKTTKEYVDLLRELKAKKNVGWGRAKKVSQGIVTKYLNEGERAGLLVKTPFRRYRPKHRSIKFLLPPANYSLG